VLAACEMFMCDAVVVEAGQASPSSGRQARILTLGFGTTSCLQWGAAVLCEVGSKGQQQYGRRGKRVCVLHGC